MLLGAAHACARQMCGQPCHQRRVEGAAAADQHFRAIRLRIQQGFGNAASGELEQGGLHVFGRNDRARGENRLQPVEVEALAAGALRSAGGEEIIGQEAVEQLPVQRSAGGPGAVLVVGVAAVVLYPCIQQDIPRAAIETTYRLVRTQQRDVAEAPDIQDRALPLVAEQRLVEGRHQRCALSAGGHVAAAEIGDDVDAGEFGQQRGVADLDGEAAPGLMANRLPVAADGADIGGGQSLFLQQFGDALRGEAHPLLLGAGGAGQFIGAGCAETEQLGTQRGGHGNVVGSEQDGGAVLLDEGDIQAVEAGSGHQA
ncbi:hypothetical protein D9M71_362530 [compost metagenome]